LVDEGVKPSDIINQGLISGMNVLSDRFKKGDMYVPEVMMAAKAMHAGMNIVRTLLLGGAPVTQDFADEIGADGWAPDAASAKGLAQKLAG
jgi:methanogenic corrinoid protein MtbC1